MTLSAKLGLAMDAKKIERISKALGDETRLRIYEVIATQKNLTCSELVSMQGVTPATISHHLKILTDAELIECRKRRAICIQSYGAGNDCGIYAVAGADFEWQPGGAKPQEKIRCSGSLAY